MARKMTQKRAEAKADIENRDFKNYVHSTFNKDSFKDISISEFKKMYKGETFKYGYYSIYKELTGNKAIVTKKVKADDPKTTGTQKKD